MHPGHQQIIGIVLKCIFERAFQTLENAELRVT